MAMALLLAIAPASQQPCPSLEPPEDPLERAASVPGAERPRRASPRPSWPCVTRARAASSRGAPGLPLLSGGSLWRGGGRRLRAVCQPALPGCSPPATLGAEPPVLCIGRS
jgi:hypothetical protein